MKGKASRAPRPWATPLRGPSSYQCRLRQTARGFSTVEIMTVIAIGMIVSVIGLSGAQIFNHRLPPKSAATRLSHALSTARAFAVSNNGFYQVILDMDTRNFWIDEIPNPALSPSDPAAGQFRPKIVSPEVVDQRVTIQGVLAAGSPAIQSTGRHSFIFRPDGAADRDARIYFLSARDNPADGSAIFTVRLYGPTGHNHVFERQRA